MYKVNNVRNVSVDYILPNSLVSSSKSVNTVQQKWHMTNVSVWNMLQLHKFRLDSPLQHVC